MLQIQGMPKLAESHIIRCGLTHVHYPTYCSKHYILPFINNKNLNVYQQSVFSEFYRLFMSKLLDFELSKYAMPHTSEDISNVRIKNERMVSRHDPKIHTLIFGTELVTHSVQEIM